MKTLVLITALLIHGAAFATEPVKTNCAKKVEAIVFPDASTGVGLRGMMLSKSEMGNSAEAASVGQKDLHQWWGQKVYIAKSVDEAIEHDRLEPNRLLKGWYIVANTNLNDVFKGPAGEVPDQDVQNAYSKLADHDVYWIDLNHEAHKIDKETVRRLLPIQNAEIRASMEYAKKSGIIHVSPAPKSVATIEYIPQVHFYFKGWFAPQFRGLIPLDIANPDSSSTQKEALKNAHKYFEEGFRITFNQDFMGILKLLGVQERSVKNLYDGARLPLDPASNRYNPKDFAEVAKEDLAAHKAGAMQSVELWSPEGKLVAGILVLTSVEGNTITPDTIAYDTKYVPAFTAKNPKFKFNLMDAASLTALALSDRVRFTTDPITGQRTLSGINILDAIMLTQWTEDRAGGQYFGRDEALSLIRGLPKEHIGIDWQTPWIPPPVPVVPPTPKGTGKKK